MPRNGLVFVKDYLYPVFMERNELSYQVIAESIDYLVAHYAEQPDLEFLARRAGYELTHFQKLFKRHVGISPKRLVQYMNLRYAKDLIAHTCMPLLDVAVESGLSGAGRLHELFIACEAMAPGVVRNKGRGLRVFYGFYPSLVGEILIARTEVGICWLGFLHHSDRSQSTLQLKAFLPEAAFIHDDIRVEEDGRAISRLWSGKEGGSGKIAFKLDLQGTNFQIQVWQALLRIPYGRVTTYGEIARQVCTEKASRAVGNAVGSNPVALLIPCHRVIRSSGIIDNYAWGSARKKLILALEKGHEN